MKTLFRSIALILSLGALSAAPLHEQKKDKPTKDLVEKVDSSNSFKTLAALLDSADMVDDLKRDNRPYTVFAPTDEAFAKLPKGTVEDLRKLENKHKLIQILLNHVVKGESPLSQALEAGEVGTLQGSIIKVRLEEGKVKFGEALLTTADVKTTNGVIHVIDTVIIPPPVKKSDIRNPDFRPDKGECDETGCTPSVGAINVLKYTEAEINEMLKHSGAKFTRGRESMSDRKNARENESERE